MKITEFCLENRTTTLFLTAVAIAGGLFSFNTMGRLEDPEFVIKDALVITPYPGATALEVEQEVSDKIEQAVQEFAFKYRGFSLQQEWHRKFVTDRVEGTESDLTGFYIQSGYFFHNLFDAFPAPLELAARYAYVSEPNKSMRSIYNEREEFTLGANWFFAGHSNKITVDFSHLTLDDGLMMSNHSENRFRIQWDVSF